jgi:hypothetical protein
MEARRSWPAPFVIGVLLLAALVGAYFGGYWALSVKHSGATPDDWCRIFRTPWLAEIYKPAAKVESLVTGDEVTTYCSAANP